MYFDFVEKVKYEGSKSKNPFAFKFYDADKVVMGKPMTQTVDYVTSLLGCERDEIAFVGDRLANDIAIGADHGVPCALVLSGVTTMQDYEAAGIPASVVVDDLAALKEYI